jgi:hypothetical protein
MRVYGSIRELVSAVFRKNSQEVTIQPSSGTYTGARVVELPEELTAGTSVLVSRSSTDTLLNKTLGSGTSITAGTITGATINADLNTITNIDNADIKNGANIDAAKIGTGAVSTTEFNYLDGVTSGLQGQLDAKAPTTSPVITGGATVRGTFLLQNLTGSQPLLQLSEDPDNGTNTVSLQAPANLTADYTFDSSCGRRYQWTSITN